MADFLVKVPLSLYRVMQEHGEKTYPFECCGILVGRKEDDHTITIARVVPAENQEKERGKDRFVLDPLFYLQTEKSLEKGETIVGFYHSHPDCPELPSQTDLLYAQGWLDFLWIIERIEQGTHIGSRVFRLTPDGSRFEEGILKILFSQTS